MSDLSDGFCDIAIHEFAFLSKFGFKLICKNAGYLRFETEKIFIEIFLSKAGEIDLGVDLIMAERERRRSFGLDEFIQREDPVAAERFRAYIASSNEEIDRGLKKLARDFQIYAIPVIAEDESIFCELENVREERIRDHEHQLKMEMIRRAADAAWKAKDFRTIVELFTSVQESLTTTEIKRLNYSKKCID